MTPFTDPDHVARYTDGPARQVPGLIDLHKMAQILLAERVGAQGHVLILGAGGGLEMRSFASAAPGWRFTGVDPSRPMLDLARQVMGDAAGRAELIEGKIDAAPVGPFDGAACLLTMHFVPQAEKLATLTALRARLKPDAPLVVAHLSAPGETRALWLSRYAAFSALNGIDPDRARLGAAKIEAELPVLSPDEDEALLAQAGFRDVGLFYAGFAFRGWVATA